MTVKPTHAFDGSPIAFTATPHSDSPGPIGTVVGILADEATKFSGEDQRSVYELIICATRW